MKRVLVLFSFIALAFMITVAGAATGGTSSGSSSSTSTSSVSASTTVSAQDQSSEVYLGQVVLDPQVFYPGESGTITVTLSNAGSSSVGLSDAGLIDPSIHVNNQATYQSVSYIGPGANLTYTFLVTAGGSEGTYFPLFSVGTLNAQSVHYPIKVVVDSTPIQISIADKPDNFALNATNMVNLSIVNPRDGDINNLLIVPEGSGFVSSPTESFTGTLSAGSSTTESFAITPHQQTTVTFHVTYRNGKNPHSEDVVLPLTIGQDKTAANPVINNIALTTSGSSYQLTGDVTNAGITDAKGMVVTVLPPASPVEPYNNYGIGALATDDFSSFTLTFTASDLSSIPVQIQWKDSQGNTFSTVTYLDLRTLAGSLSGTRNGATGSSGSSGGSAGAAAGGNFRGGGGGGAGLFGGRGGGGLSSFYPVIAGTIIVIAGIVLYMKRKWIKSKLKKQ